MKVIMIKTLKNLCNYKINKNAVRLSSTKLNYQEDEISNSKPMIWKSVIGLEIHAQISTKSKLFSGSEYKFASPINSCVSLFDSAIPGTLPVLNRACVEAGIKTALALKCKINAVSMFDRKHYFYADLPAGYQITQQRAALANNGAIDFPVFFPGITKKPYRKTVKLSQLQLEQDSGKSIHDDLAKRSLVDLNRAGISLMELVFEPDLENGEEAASLVKELILIFKRLETCNCKMEEGALRVDANVSIHREGEPLGIRTEIKNIGSVRNVAQAITYEIKRQIDLKNNGQEVKNETRSWEANTRKTISMRDKEVQQDYRFMPEPNLPPLRIDLTNAGDIQNDLIKVMEIQKKIPELPEDTRIKLCDNYKLSEEISIILVNEPVLLNYFHQIVEQHENFSTKMIGNFLINDVLSLCNKNNIDIEECKITSEQLVKLIELLKNNTINLQIARLVLQDLNENSSSCPLEIIKNKNLLQISDIDELENLCKQFIEKNPKAVQQYKKGKKKVLFAIAGDIAKATNQRANMALVIKKLEELLK